MKREGLIRHNQYWQSNYSWRAEFSQMHTQSVQQRYYKDSGVDAEPIDYFAHPWFSSWDFYWTSLFAGGLSWLTEPTRAFFNQLIFHDGSPVSFNQLLCRWYV